MRFREKSLDLKRVWDWDLSLGRKRARNFDEKCSVLGRCVSFGTQISLQTHCQTSKKMRKRKEKMEIIHKVVSNVYITLTSDYIQDKSLCKF